jgi:two-component system NarL family response regulator
MIRPIRLLVAVPNRMLRGGLSLLLEGQSDIQLLGLPETMDEAVRAFAQQRPDLVLIGLPLSSTNAVNAIIGIRAIDPTAWIIAFASDECGETASQALSAGAATVLRTDLIGEMLLPVIRAALQAEKDSETPQLAGTDGQKCSSP